MKMLKKILEKRAIRNVIIGVVLGTMYFFLLQIDLIFSASRSLRQYLSIFTPRVWDYLSILVISAIINIFVGKAREGKIFNTFIVCTIAHFIYFAIMVMFFAHAFRGW